MLRGILGQAVGVASISVWLSLTVLFMSKAAVTSDPNQGNWFLYFALTTIVFVLVMTFWRRFFGEESDTAHA